MKSIPYSRLARMLTGNYQWWEINTTYKMNQNYTYCFSCSWHGGIIIAYDTLSPSQKEKLISFYNSEEHMNFDMVAYSTVSNRATAWARFKEPDETNINVRFLCFEEDSDWAIPYTLLWIANEHFLSLPEDKQKEYSNSCMKRYYDANTDTYNFHINH